MRVRRVCSWLLVFILIVCMFSVNVFAGETEKVLDNQMIEEDAYETYSPEELIEEESNNTNSREEDSTSTGTDQKKAGENILVGYEQGIPSVSWAELCALGQSSTTDEYYFNQLSDFEKGFYEFDKALETSTEQYVDEFVLTDVPMDITDINPLCEKSHVALLSDDPTLRMKRQRLAYGNKVYGTDNSYTITFVKDGFYSEYRYEKALNRVNDIINAIDQSDDRYTKIKKLGSYRNAFFSYDVFVDSFYSPTSDSAYGLLIKNRAVCAGFADTFKILCNKVGVPCIIVGNAGHAWNYVQMEDGKWYSIDWQDLNDHLLGKNSALYLDEPNFHISELYVGAPGYFVFPELADDEYVYTGDNEDYSINVDNTEYDVTDKGFQYFLNPDRNSYQITGYKGIIPNHLEIPDNINGLPVTVIGTHAFDNETGITGELILPQSIIEIQECAFEGCTGITEIVFNDNLTKIGDAAFFGCTGISGSVVLPNRLESLGKYAFYDCKNLNGSFYIPKSITSIDVMTAKNSSIKEFIVDPENDKYSVFDGVLYSRDGKTLLVFPYGKSGELRIKEGTQIIADNACNGCTGITSVSFPDSLISIKDYAFMNCRFKGDLEIPNGVETIGYCAFMRESQYSCDGGLSLPLSLKTIGSMAFYGCGLTGNIILSPNIETIGTTDDGYMVFGENNIDSFTVYCSNDVIINYMTQGLLLQEGDIKKLNVIHSICPDSEVSIGDNCPACGNVIDRIPAGSASHLLARVPYQESTCLNTGTIEHWFCCKCHKRFADNEGAIEVSINDLMIDVAGHNWNEISRTDLSSYDGVQSILLKCETCREINEKYLVTNNNYSVYDGVLYSRDGKILLSCPKNKIGVLSIQEGTEIIADKACKNCEKIEGVILPDSLKSIGDSAFQYTRFSGDLVLPDSIEYIGFEAFDRDPFYGFGGKLVLPAAVKEIKGWAFVGCGFNGELYIPSTIEKIGCDESDLFVTNISVFGGSNNFTSYVVACDNTLIKEYLTNAGDWDYSSQIQYCHPICTETDYTDGMICSSCNTPIESIDNALIAGHEYEEIEGTAEAATCITDGKEADKKCHRCNNVLLGSVIEKIGHNLEKTEAKDATCTDAGNTEYYTCGRCHKLYSDKDGKKEINLSDTVVAAKGHTAGNIVEENIVEATCTENGSHDVVIYCVVCNEKLGCSSNTDVALGHDWGEWTVIKEATEEEEGLEERTCMRNGSHKETRVIPKKDHVHVLEKTIAKDATCTEDGNIEYWTCKGCGRFFTDAAGNKEVTSEELIIKKTGHTAGEPVVENKVEATCTKAGSYDKVTYCTVCKEEITRTTVPVEALGHKLIKTEAKDATCTEAGNTEYYTCERCHKLYSDKAGTKEIQLSDTIVAANGHTAGNIVEENKTEATCTENGSHDEVTYCTVCNTELSRITKTDAALGHVWGEWTVIREATEEEEGLEERICARDETHKETRVIPKKDHVHVLEKVEMKDSTCTESGNIEYYFCTGCGHIFTDENGSEEIDSESVIIPMKAHQAGDTVTENYVDATCENPGSYDEVTRCTVCEKELSRVKKTIAAHGHMEVIDEALAPTCEDSGLTEGSHCSVCGKTIKAQEEISATGHDWGEWKVVTEPTYTSEGLERRYCKNDESHVDEHVIDKIVPEYAITLDRTEAALTFGKTMTIVATITPADAPKPEVTWTSSDKSIADVDPSGIVTAKGVGTATITASLSDGTKATCEVTVNKAASSISLKAKSVIYSGKTINIDPAAVTGSTGKVTYNYYSDSACKNKVTSHKNAGTYYVKATVAADANYKSAVSKAVKLTINKAASTIALKAKTANYTGKTININPATVKGSSGKVTYAYYSDSKCTKKVIAHKSAGTYYVKATVAADQNYKGAVSKAVKLTINKITNTITAKAKTGLTASAKTNTSITKAKAFTISKAQGKLTFKKTKGDAKITVASNGNVTVKKGLKKGTTYSVTVKVTAAGNTNYKAGFKTVILKIKIN